MATLTAAARGGDTSFKEETAAGYYDALTRLMIADDLPAWSPHIRSSATLRKAPKRHLADTSLAGGALRLTVPRLRADLEYLGLLFESAAIHDLRVFAQALGAELFHYRDSRGGELDAVMVLPDRSWIAFEVKLGFGAAEEAAGNLIAVAGRIDVDRMGEPAALVVITANGFAHRRADGVAVVPLGVLAP
jgi:predicted AAA+ superfamily ATPase